MHRIQLLCVTLIFAIGYLIEAVSRGPGQGMPDIAGPVLLALIGSQATYLGGKALS